MVGFITGMPVYYHREGFIAHFEVFLELAVTESSQCEFQLNKLWLGESWRLVI